MIKLLILSVFITIWVSMVLGAILLVAAMSNDRFDWDGEKPFKLVEINVWRREK